MKLTTFAKILIVLVLMVALFFLFREIIPSSKNGDDPEASTPTSVEQVSDPVSSTADFNYIPKAPEGGMLKGVVELGAAGFNSFIIRIDRNKNWKLEKAEWGNSLVYDGLATGEDVRDGLKKYIAGMLDYGVPGKEIHFMVSSGARTVETTQTIIDALEKMKYVVNTVTPEQEAQFALKSVLPPEFEDKAFVVDIGSGNTKISWIENGKIVGKDSYGAKYYSQQTPDDQVYNTVVELAKTIPASLRENCFIIGGVPFSLAKLDRKGEERYTVLRAPDTYEADGAKTASGLNIYKGIRDGSGCRNFVFDWDANFTIGFLLSL